MRDYSRLVNDGWVEWVRTAKRFGPIPADDFRFNNDEYRIKYSSAVKSIRQKVFKMAEKLEKSRDTIYYCKMCSSAWTQLDVIDNCGTYGFLCRACNTELQYDRDRIDSLSRFESQICFIRNLLPSIQDNLDT